MRYLETAMNITTKIHERVLGRLLRESGGGGEGDLAAYVRERRP